MRTAVTGPQDWAGGGVSLAQQRRFVRRIDLAPPGEETIYAADRFAQRPPVPATALLELYRARWSLERVCHQLTAVCQLHPLMGTRRQGTVLQFAFCLFAVQRGARRAGVCGHRPSAPGSDALPRIAL